MSQRSFVAGARLELDFAWAGDFGELAEWLDGRPLGSRRLSLQSAENLRFTLEIR